MTDKEIDLILSLFQIKDYTKLEKHIEYQSVLITYYLPGNVRRLIFIKVL